MDIRHRFLTADGRADLVTMADDAVHLRPAGYEAWAEEMAPLLEELMAD
jgi:lysophospholipase L1-like esterase